MHRHLPRLSGTAVSTGRNMEPGMRSLLSDNSRYVESFRLFLKNSTEHQCMQQYIEGRLPDVVSSIGNGKTIINVLGVGSGSGEIDLKIFSKIQARYPGIPINTDIVEPSPEQMVSYKERVAKTTGLENINFNWHKKTSSEFELQVKKEKSERKYDLIHMIQCSLAAWALDMGESKGKCIAI
ncbi:histamine N-methyltransferase isoform X2 [Dendrobates tinctorius]|uniref:histamine N-methyltransferase isoform X2 n=1 Tax=Dendrobates tinctorius TaxID=92724 RepID=UPI003CC9AFC1